MCHPFLFNKKKVDPEDVARRDEISAHLVESVKAHSGDKKLRSSMDFLVSYAGYDSSYDQWQPWKEVRNNPALHKYLWDNAMKALIPQEHRVNEFSSRR